MEMMRVFAWNMKKYRKKKGLTQEKLAEILNTATSYIGEIEINNGNPSMEMVEKIANALDIEPFRLFVDDNERIKNEPQPSLKGKGSPLDASDYLEGLTTIERQDFLKRIIALISSDLEQILQPENRG
jgi:transcriptional regulator with XRE-family HTH domain